MEGRTMKGKLLYFTIGLLAGVGLMACSEDDAAGDRTLGPEPDHPPQVTITRPADRSFFQILSRIEFEGLAIDSEGDQIPGQNLTWASSISDSIGEGTSFERRLSEGHHIITLTAKWTVLTAT